MGQGDKENLYEVIPSVEREGWYDIMYSGSKVGMLNGRYRVSVYIAGIVADRFGELGTISEVMRTLMAEGRYELPWNL